MQNTSGASISETINDTFQTMWDWSTFGNLRNAYSFCTNLTAIGSSVAALLPGNSRQIVAPVLGSLSFTSLQGVYRADNDE